MTIRADVDNPSGTGSVGPGGDQALVVSQDPDQDEYGSIQNAIDDADGTDVLVEAGTYNEAIVIDKDGLTLRSLAGAGQTTIVASASSQDNKAIIVDGASDVSINGFSITFDSESATNSEKYGIRARAGSDNLVVRNSIIGNFSTEDGPNNSGAVRATGVVVTSQQGSSTASTGTQTAGPTIENNIFENIRCTGEVDPSNSDSDSKAKGVALNGKIAGAIVGDNSFTGIGTVTNDPNGAQDALTDNSAIGTAKPRGISLTEDGNGDGPTNFTIVRNDFDGIAGTYGQPSIFIGSTNALGSGHIVKRNNFRHPVDSLSSETLQLKKNWWSRADPPNTAPSDQDEDGGILISRDGSDDGTDDDPGVYSSQNPLGSQQGNAGASL
jgi:hypothetical protein